MNLMTVLLIGILYNPATQQYGEMVVPFDTMESCQARLTEMLKTIPHVAGTTYALMCVQTKPTDGMEI